ncbi:MAG: PD-(D/E)XK nuclease domain-containing protein [Bacteroidales bacterium]|nr:PD-(D/E)XK nuclease domain-containing protein [Bacteroidales bacterium]
MKRSQMEDNVIDLQGAFAAGDVKKIIASMESILSSVPYHLWPEKSAEAPFHMLVHVICMVAGISTQSEMSQSKGRVDMVCNTHIHVYVFEFKLDGFSEEALAQIDERCYALRWNADGRKVYKIGVVFSSKDRNISSWAVG